MRAWITQGARRRKLHEDFWPPHVKEFLKKEKKHYSNSEVRLLEATMMFDGTLVVSYGIIWQANFFGEGEDGFREKRIAVFRTGEYDRPFSSLILESGYGPKGKQ